MGRRVALLLVVLGCGHGLESSTPVTVQGTLTSQAGAPLAGAQVSLQRTPEALAAKTSLPCWPESTFEDFQTATTDAQGRYSFTLVAGDARFAGGASRCLRLSQAAPPGALHIAFDVHDAQVNLGAAAVRDVALQASGPLSFSWIRPQESLDGQSLLLFTQDGWPVWRTDGVDGSAQLDPQLVEDGAHLARWLGVHALPGQSVTVAWTQDLDAAAGSALPPSRGAACDAEGVSLPAPCPLTNGLFRDPLAEGKAASVTVHLQQPTAPHRLLVHNLLADARSLRVQGSSDGAAFTTLAEVKLSGAYPWFLDVPLAGAAVSHLRLVPLDAPQGAPAIRALAQVSLF